MPVVDCDTPLSSVASVLMVTGYWGLEVQSFTTTLPACRYFFITGGSQWYKIDVAGSVPVVVNSAYSVNNVNAGKIVGSEQRSVVDAGIYSHSGGAGAVPVMNFGEKLQLYWGCPGRGSSLQPGHLVVYLSHGNIAMTQRLCLDATAKRETHDTVRLNLCPLVSYL